MSCSNCSSVSSTLTPKMDSAPAVRTVVARRWPDDVTKVAALAEAAAAANSAATRPEAGGGWWERLDGWVGGWLVQVGWLRLR